MRYLFIGLFFCFSCQAQQHCGYDFTSYLVLFVHEDGKKDNISDLRITLIDSTGLEAVNVNNRYSWRGKDQVLLFTQNYRLNSDIKTADSADGKWFFPYAKDVWLLSVTNTFPADQMQVRITDPEGRYHPQDVPLYAFNLYVLCTTQAEQAVQFGRRVNKPVDIVLRRK